MAQEEILGNLVWIDLEMTGLNPEADVILEIASVITDGQLNIIQEGPALIINQPEDKLTAMSEWSQEQHAKTGLTDAVRASKVTLEQAQEQTLIFIKKHCKLETGLLAGNSVWQDRAFMYHYMPNIIQFLHYRLIDVTTIKELVLHWYPDEPEFEKKDVHRAQKDIYESIAELKYYKEKFFV